MRTRLLPLLSAAVAGLGLAAACSRVSAPGHSTSPPSGDPAALVAQANATLLDEATALARAQWVNANFITEDTEPFGGRDGRVRRRARCAWRTPLAIRPTTAATQTSEQLR